MVLIHVLHVIMGTGEKHAKIIVEINATNRPAINKMDIVRMDVKMAIMEYTVLQDAQNDAKNVFPAHNVLHVTRNFLIVIHIMRVSAILTSVLIRKVTFVYNVRITVGIRVTTGVVLVVHHVSMKTAF